MVDIWFLGQACFKIKGKNASVVVDPYKGEFTGLRLPKIDANIVCVTHDHADHNFVSGVIGTEAGTRPFVIEGPGEYEILGINVVGVASFHDDENGAQRGKNTIYHLTIDDVNIVHLGDLGQKKLTQEQVETLSTCDILLIPVGGKYTISAREAPDIIAAIEPKIVIPMHYKLEGSKLELDGVDKFLTAMGKEKIEPQSKLSISRERLPDEVELFLLSKQ